INPKTGKAASPKTVKDSDLAALKSVFGWAVANNKLDGNPAEGVTVKVNKRKKSRPNYFREDERYKILNQSRHYHSKGREREKLSRAKRWIPWICAYTGARVGEIAQLRKQDIRLEEGVWIINITPEAGDVKSKAAREVPIHNHLIEVGLIEMVREARDGYLFIDVEPGKHPRGKVQTLKNDLAEFVRIVVPDPDIQPNHGWRHTFRTLAREIQGIDSKVIDDIVGHAPKSVGDRYGESTIKARAMVMQRFPRFID
ncbi:MAG: tyrosine-type recombinase/integrase, partial [Pseudomonadales bacterium]